MFELATRMHNVQGSPTLKLNALVRELKAKGEDIINLTAGEVDLPTPKAVVDAATEAMQAGFTRYTAAQGMPELREAVSAWFARRFQLEYPAANIAVTCGLKQALYNYFQVVLNPGDEVVFAAPFWVSYPEQVKLAGGVPVVLATKPENAFCIDVQELAKKITAKTKVLILNSPNNPTGAIQPKAVLADIAKLLEGTSIQVLSDEIYAELTYEADAFFPFAGLSADAYTRTFTLNGLSKSHAMTGWRVGFIAGDEKIIKAMNIVQGQSASCAVSFVQKASIEAVNTQDAFIEKLHDSLKHRRDLAYEWITRDKNIRMEKPAGAFYCFPDVSAYYNRKSTSGFAVTDSESMAEYLLTEAKVAVVPGKPCGEDRCVRISFALEQKDLETGIERIYTALQKLSP